MNAIDDEEAQWLRTVFSGADYSEVAHAVINTLAANPLSRVNAGELGLLADWCWSAGETTLATRLRRKLTPASET